MLFLTTLLLCSPFIPSVLSLQLPFKLPFFKQRQPPVALLEPDVPPRVAVIGAGAAGSSAAFWISKAKERFGIDVDIDVYERASNVGGRCTTVYPYDDASFAPLELGASIFVDANKNLMRAAKEFDLNLTTFIDESMDMDTGIWDGEKFDIILDETTYTKSWWTTLKVLWRYGYSAPVKTQAVVKNMITEYLRLYTTESPRWDNVADLVEKMDWQDLVNQTAFKYLSSKGVAERWSRDMVEAATRVNYGQNVDEIHALGGTCSLAANGAYGVATGNFHLFENFLKRSGATVYLDTEVKNIVRVPTSSRWIVHTASGSKIYKAVILAAPFHQTDIVIPDDLAELIPQQPYVRLHVTLFATRSERADPTYFGLPAGSRVPKMVLTTHEAARAGGFEPEFNSISYHGLIRADEEPEWSVKIFSKERVSDEWLEKVFGRIGWVYRKEWDAYPVLTPTTEFPPVRLDQGFYYVNAFEPFISTMETETIASRNVVDLLLHEEFGSGICGSQLSGHEAGQANVTRHATEPDFVLGWDC